MEGAVIKGNLQIHHRETTDRTILERFLDTLLHTGDKLLGNDTTSDLVPKYKPSARLACIPCEIYALLCRLLIDGTAYVLVTYCKCVNLAQVVIDSSDLPGVAGLQSVNINL